MVQFGVLSSLSESLSLSLSLQLFFGTAEYLSSLPQAKLIALEIVVELVLHSVAVRAVASAADECVPQTVTAVSGLAVEAVDFTVAILGLAAEDLIAVSSGCPLPAHAPLHLGMLHALCILRTSFQLR